MSGNYDIIRSLNGMNIIYTNGNPSTAHPTDLATVVRAYVAYLTFDYLRESTSNIQLFSWVRRNKEHPHGECKFARAYIHYTYGDLRVQNTPTIRVLIPTTQNNFNILTPDRVALGDDIIITRCYTPCSKCTNQRLYTTIAITRASTQIFHYIIARFATHVCNS